MSKEAVENSTLKAELFRAGLYKRSQGRIARQATFAAIAVVFVLGSWRLMNEMKASKLEFLGKMAGWFGYSGEPGDFASGLQLHLWVPGVLLVLGVWFAYRVVNFARFADFLIAVEAEMNKVSWPSRQELYRSSLVVIVVIFVMAAVLFTYDIFWGWLFELIGVLRQSA